MMDGYSVPETASVLGVPEGKVWELLARGVLSGTPEGDGMRVFLKENPAPMASHGDRFEAPRANGGSSPAGEATPFRELLTEFRNLTERYGQALLALGEARGEVAGLRSRVDLLEARLDLRLPGPGIVPPVAWERPASPASVAEPEDEPESDQAARKASARAEPPTRRTTPQRRSHTARSAVAGFAEALARAQDPTTAEMPSVAEVANHVAPLEGSGVEEADAITPADVVADAAADTPADASAEAIETIGTESAPPDIAEESRDTTAAGTSPSYSTDVIEPDWFADGDFAWLDAAEIEAQVATASIPRAPDLEPVPEPEPEPVPEPVPEPEPEPEQFGAQSGAFDAGSDIGLVVPQPAKVESDFLDALLDAESTAVAVESVPTDFAPVPESELADEPDLAPEYTRRRADPFYVGVEPGLSPDHSDNPRPHAEPDWLDRPQEMANEMEVASSGWREPAVAEAQTDPKKDEGLARLARQEGWDAAEVDAIRALVGQGAPNEIQLPGADDLDEAIAALNATRPATRGAVETIVAIEAAAVDAEPSVESWVNAGLGASDRPWAPARVSTEPPGFATPRDEPPRDEPPRNEPPRDEPPRPEPTLRQAVFTPPPTPRPSATRQAPGDPSWLRGRRGPAATAFRRLRRLFTE